MPVDTSMYGMIQPIDAMGAIEGGMKMRDLIDERKKKSALQDAYKQGMKVGPDGKVSMDHNMTASALAKGGYGQEAYEAQQQGQSEQQKQMEAHVKNAQYGAQVLGAARNENEWNQGLQHLQTIMDVSTLPPYSPQNQKMLVDSAMTLQDRLQQQNKDRDFNAGRQDRKRAEEMDLAKLGIVQGHQAKMQGNQFAQQEKMAGLTAQQQERQAMLKAVAEKAGQGAKQLPPDKVLLVNEGNSIPTMLKDISTTIDANPDAFGPVAGRLGSMNPYDEKAQAIQSQVRAASQAFGRYMEGGVLRKEDEVKYERMFPQPSDTPETAKNKLAIVNKILVDKQRSNLEALQKSGYDIKGLSGTDLGEGQVPNILGGKGGPPPLTKDQLGGMSREEKIAEAMRRGLLGAPQKQVAGGMSRPPGGGG